MSQIDYTTTASISTIKRRASIPAQQNLFTNSDLVEILNDELQTYVVPLMMRIREEFFVTSSDTSIVSGTASYEIPANAIGKKLRSLYVIDDAGNRVEIPRLNPEDLSEVGLNDISGYYLQGDDVVLYPTPSSSGTLRMFFYRRLSKLIATDYAAKIQSINAVTNEVTFESVPSTWTTATLLDCIDKNPSFKIMLSGTQATAVAGYVLTLPAATVALLEVGDWLAEIGESPLPQIPVEMQSLLEQAAVVRVLEAMGGQSGNFQLAVGKLQQMEEAMLGMLKQRVEGNPKKITNKRGIWRS